MALKMDLEKASNKLSWEFVESALKAFGFHAA